MRRRCPALLVALAAVTVPTALVASPPESRPPAVEASPLSPVTPEKFVDEPNPVEARRMRERRRFVRELDERLRRDGVISVTAANAAAAAKTGRDRVLVILVEFAGTDTFTWTLGSSTWDPLGKADTSEAVYDASGKVKIGDCSKIIKETKSFTYTGPLHNQIDRPLSASDRSGDMIWVPDFAPSYYGDIIFGNGITFDYLRQDGSKVFEPFTGKSVNTYFQDASSNRYSITGEIVGWLQVPHSTWFYGADPCPGARSGASSSNGTGGAIPGAGSARQLVKDALDAVKAARPTFDWAAYDENKDGLIDRLWIIHAGLGEEDAPTVLNRTSYGEAAMWSHSSSLSPAYEVAPGVKAGPYIMMPENAGIGVLAHEFAHNLGADDLYSYSGGDTSAGFWTLMADDWTGYPIAFQPPALDPWHLDGWGWLEALVVSETSPPTTVTIGQASAFPADAGLRRAVKIQLADQHVPLPVKPLSTLQWWGGATNLSDATMILRQPLAIPAAGATLTMSMAWKLEEKWDFLWVQASDDAGATWKTLTNAHTTCQHDAKWIGGSKGFPADLCAAGIGGFTGASVTFPAYADESFDLQAFAGKQVLLRLWYMTDPFTVEDGPFVGALRVTSGSTELLRVAPEAGTVAFAYADGWDAVADWKGVAHAFYLQWRNVSAAGGWDSALADPRWRYGPANTGLLVWYNNDLYEDNELPSHLTDAPGFGPKGRVLLVDAHPEPYRSPALIAQGWDNEGGNLPARSQMRDATFSLRDSLAFSYGGESFAGRQAVSLFSDAQAFQPGAARVSLGPSAQNPATGWVTQQWDASVLLPATRFVGLKAPGYTASEALRYTCTRDTNGTLKCTGLLAGGLGYDGGTGNPGDVGGRYGWNAQILGQSDDRGTVRVWSTAWPGEARARTHLQPR